METIKTIGLDIAKSVFQVHGVDGGGRIVVRRRLTRSRMLPFFAKLPPCLVGIEACNNSHYWARELMALGHVVKLMPAQYVKPYVKGGKNDAADAGDLRGSDPADHALCGCEGSGAAEHDDVASSAADAEPSAHTVVECDQGAFVGVRHCRLRRPQRRRSAS